MSGAATAPPFASIAAVAELIRARQLSCVELLQSTLERIAQADGLLNSCAAVLVDRAAADALRLDRELGSGRNRGPLHGVPVVVKDNVDIAGTPTTAGSTLLPGVPASESAPSVRQLERAGAIVIAKTNMYELAYGGPNPAFGTVHNPWGDGLATGGSSSGAAVAVAAGFAYAALASDSGGSIRIPSACCGVAALKPTVGRVATDGIVPVSPTLDHAGPIARTVEDLALAMSALDQEFGELGADGVAGLRVGTLSPDAYEPVHSEVRAALVAAESILGEAGAQVRVVRLPSLDAARKLKWVISGAEAATTHRALLADRRDELQPQVRELLEEGERVTAPEYEAALREREAMRTTVASVFDDVDALLLPALPTAALAEGAATVEIGGRSEGALRSTTRFMSLFNVTGSPAVVVPVGVDAQGAPLSVQVAAALDDDLTALRVARAVEWLGGPARHPPDSVSGR